MSDDDQVRIPTSNSYLPDDKNRPIEVKYLQVILLGHKRGQKAKLFKIFKIL